MSTGRLYFIVLDTKRPSPLGHRPMLLRRVNRQAYQQRFPRVCPPINRQNFPLPFPPLGQHFCPRQPQRRSQHLYLLVDQLRLRPVCRRRRHLTDPPPGIPRRIRPHCSSRKRQSHRQRFPRAERLEQPFLPEHQSLWLLFRPPKQLNRHRVPQTLRREHLSPLLLFPWEKRRYLQTSRPVPRRGLLSH